MSPDLHDEIEFRDLLKKPEKLFPYAFLYFLGALFLLGMMYLWNINSVGANAIAPAALKDSSAFIQDIPFQAPVMLPPVDIRTASVASDSLIARGRELFRGNCIACHGESGMGDGPSAATLNPKPRNFHSLSGWTNGSKVSQIYRTLEEGIVKNGMASYNYLPPVDRFALAHFIRTLSPGQPVDSPEDLEALESAYQLSKGKAVPGQIPLKKAEEILVREGAPEAARAKKFGESLAVDGGPAAGLLRRNASSLERVAVTTLGAPLPGLEEFIRARCGAPALYGLKPAVNRLSRGDWSTIYSYLDSARKRWEGGTGS